MGDQSFRWLNSNSAMARQIRLKDWSQTPLGDVMYWPAALRNSVQIILQMPLPAALCWGEKYTLICNDAYRELACSERSVLGVPCVEEGHRTAARFMPYFEKALKGEIAYARDMDTIPAQLKKKGQGVFDIRFTPLEDTEGDSAGVFCVVFSHKEGNTRRPSFRKSRSEMNQETDLYEALLSSISDFAYIFDRKGRFIYVNQPLLNLWGLSREEAKGKSFYELPYPEELAAMHERQIQQVVESREELVGENEYTNPSGESGYYEYIFSPITDEDGEVEYIAGLTRDITKRKDIEQNLRFSEKRLRIASQAANMQLCILDLNKKTLSWSDRLIQNSDVPLPESWNAFLNILHQDDTERVVGQVTKAAEGQGDFEAEYRIQHPVTGRIIWMYSAGTELDKNEGRYNRVVIANKDITNRKEIEVRDQFLSRLSLEIQRVSDPGQIMNVTTRLLGKHLNADRCTYAQIEEDENRFEILGSYTYGNMAAMQPMGSMAVFGNVALRSMRQNELFTVHNVEEDTRIGKAEKGGYHDSSIGAFICVPLHKEGQFIAKLAVHQQKPRHWLDEEAELVEKVAQRCWEAIERARVQRQLIEMNRTLEDRVEKRTSSLKVHQKQLQSLALELSKAEERERNNLATDLHSNLAQLLALGKMRLDELGVTNLTEENAVEIDRIKELIDEALSYTRELMSELQPPPLLDNNSLIEILQWVAEKMRKHGLEVVIKGINPSVELDEATRTTLHRSVRELLFNVAKHANVEKASITVSQYEPGILMITIADKGRGFVKEDLKSAPSSQGGFGLFNIEEQMDLIGGRFTIDSGPDEGTKATLYMPVTINKHADERPAPEVPAISADSGIVQDSDSVIIEILLVDDHEMMRKGLRNLIEQQSNLRIVAEAARGRDAIEKARNEEPAVIIMDIDLPDISGIEATKEIIDTHPEISVIGLSIHDHPQLLRDMKTAGASAFLNKAEAFESLVAMIQHHSELRPENSG